MISKFNCLDIIKSHTETLRDFNQQRILKRELFFFYGTPLICAVIGAYFLLPDLDKLEGVIVSVYAIFIPLLLNLLLFNLAEIKKQASDPIYSNFLREIHHNVSFSVLISIFGIVISIFDFLLTSHKLYSFFLCKFGFSITTDSIFFFLLIYIGVLFSLSLFMILKRVHVLLEQNNNI
jgi:hypothetical protein